MSQETVVKISMLARSLNDVTSPLAGNANTLAFADAIAALGVKLVAKMAQEEGV